MTENENNENEFVPKLREAENRKELVKALPTTENLPVEEITVLPDIDLVGFYDGLQWRTLKEPDQYTQKMEKLQINFVMSTKDNEAFDHGNKNSNLRLNDGETDSFVRRIWCSNGLLRELEKMEIAKGQKIKIKRTATAMAIQRPLKMPFSIWLVSW